MGWEGSDREREGGCACICMLFLLPFKAFISQSRFLPNYQVIIPILVYGWNRECTLMVKDQEYSMLLVCNPYERNTFFWHVKPTRLQPFSTFRLPMLFSSSNSVFQGMFNLMVILFCEIEY